MHVRHRKFPNATRFLTYDSTTGVKTREIHSNRFNLRINGREMKSSAATEHRTRYAFCITVV